MICGTHELKGSVEELKQPFCVLRKQETGDGNDHPQTSYTINGIVTRKLLFTRYPKTIMR
jgi:hypothetical protein